MQIQKVVTTRRLTQAQLAKLLHVSQPRVSDLLRRRLHLFSIETLIDMLGPYSPFNRSDVAAVLRRAIVITEKTTDAETATNRTIPRLTSDTVDEFVAEPLMRPLGVV